MAAVIHIGLPKTASGSLQQAVIPHLGRPYLVNPQWTQRLTRDIADAVPSVLPDDVILSDATLSDFAAAPPTLMADRLARICSGGSIILVHRDPLDLFRAIYRERLLHGVTYLRTYMNGQLPMHWPFSAGQFYVNQYKAYRQRGIGFFAMIGASRVRAAFERHFDVHVLDFELLRNESKTFVHKFAAVCDVDFVGDLPVTNESSPRRIATAIAPVAAIMPPRLIKQLTDFYTKPRLSPEQMQILRGWNVDTLGAELSLPRLYPEMENQLATAVSRPAS